jgi:NAD(P)-dependent dehydrogenase (short-subunit alcohol dehydrogenase family)
MATMQGRVALITGASSGIGKGAAIRLAKDGVKIGVLGTDPETVKKTADEIRQLGSEAIELVADVSDPQQVEEAFRKTVNEWGRLDVVFANAGINGVWAPLEELTPDEWDKTLDINLKGTFLTVKYAVPHMKQHGGSIIVTSSVNGTRMFSNTGASAYATSKAGQVAFTKMVALELAKHHIRVNVICPGAIETNIDENTEQRHTEQIKEPVEFPEGQIPLTDGQPGTSEQVGELVYFLASDMSTHISGTEIWIDGAQSLLQG